MLLQEPVQAAIWDSLNHYSYANATFLAERLFAEVASEDALHLLATCYYRSGKSIQAYSLLRTRVSDSPQCKFLLAQCCMSINKLSEAEMVLAGSLLTKSKSTEEIEVEYGNMACYVFSLLGTVYSKTERLTKASECYKRSLKLNPLLWASFQQLCDLGEKVDPCQVFKCPPPSVPTAFANTPKVVINTCPVIDNHTPVSQSIPQEENRLETPVQNSGVLNYVTPESVIPIYLEAPPAPVANRKTVVAETNLEHKRLLFIPSSSPLTPNFGFLPLMMTDSPDMSKNSVCSFITPSPHALTETQVTDVNKAPRKPVTRRNPSNPKPKPPVFNQSGNTRDNQPANQQSGLQMPNVRRSSRFLGSSNSVKENNKSQAKTRLTSPKAAGRKSKLKLSKSQQELNEINKFDLPADAKKSNSNENQTPVQLAQLQQQSIAGLMSLLQEIGKGYVALAQYECKKAVELFYQLPPRQYHTGWVLTVVGRAYFELADYQKAEKIFSEVRRLAPQHLDGMEMYSTTLWHLQRDVELSTLAQELSALEKNSPEAWCAVGNCFSLQKEHETAIKFLQRAIQVDSSFAYAYTLLGHEYVFTEELDKAMACFRSAIRVDPRHYNAWYGVGMIYFKQEKFHLAEVHYRKALTINPHSSALLCIIGVVQHALHKSESALKTLDRAISLDPKNPICNFHRASILFSNDKHEEALGELERLKKIIPKESLVYFLCGKVHKKLGNTHLALMNFSWATDLDPKGINNQIKEAIDKRYVTEDDDSLSYLGETGLDDEALVEVPDGRLQDNPSLDNVDVLLHAMESDESL